MEKSENHLLKAPRRRRRASTKSTKIFFVAAAVVIAMVLALASARSTTTTSQASDLLKVSPNDPVLGSSDAPFTVVQFGDFQCPTCNTWFRSQGNQVIQNLVNTGKAKLVWKDFDYFGADSILASKAARAAGEQGRFWDYYRVLWAKQGDPNSGWAGRTNLVQDAQDLGLNVTRFEQSLDSGKYDSIISGDFNLGKQLGVQASPTFFVIGPTGKSVMIVGDQPYSVFQQAISSVS